MEVILPKELVKLVPETHLMAEAEWRDIGVPQSPSWIHYMHHRPEPNIKMYKYTTNRCLLMEDEAGYKYVRLVSIFMLIEFYNIPGSTPMFYLIL
jgi:hypothetical protein